VSRAPSLYGLNAASGPGTPWHEQRSERRFAEIKTSAGFAADLTLKPGLGVRSNRTFTA